MKRIITFLLVAVMLVSSVAVTAGAKGQLVFSDNFDQGFMPRNWITNRETCAFEWEKKGGYIQGYGDAVALQSNFGTKNNKWWAEGYIALDFKIFDLDDVHLVEGEEKIHSITLWYTDLMEQGEAVNDAKARGALYTYNVEFETGKATLRKEYRDFKYTDQYGITQTATVDAIIAEGNIGGPIEVGADAEWNNIGWRISSGKIECYYNEQLIMSSSAADGTDKYGNTFVDAVDETVGSQKSAFVLLNDDNWIGIDNFEVWTVDYDFVDVTYGDVDASGTIDLNDVTMMLQAIAKWELTGYSEAAADVDASGAVDLNDVTHLLKYIAKWEGITLG